MEFSVSNRKRLTSRKPHSHRERQTVFDRIVPIAVGLSFIHVNAFGTVYIVELALVPVTALAWLSRARQTKVNRGVSWCIGLAFATALATVCASDLSDSAISRQATVKGLSVWFLFAFDLMLAGLYLRPDTDVIRRGRHLLTALAASELLGYFFDPLTAAQQATPWKFGFAFPISLLTACCVTKVDEGAPTVRRKLAIFAFSILAITNFFLSYRSMSLFCVFVVITLVGLRDPRTSSIDSSGARRSGALRLVFAPILMVLIFILGLSLFDREAASGVLGEAALVKAGQQGSSVESVVVSSRPEVYFLIPAIMKAPLLGQGANALLEPDEFDTGATIIEAAGANASIQDLQVGDPLPVHSELLGSWALYGIFAAVLWIAAFRFALSAIMRSILSSRLPIVTFPGIVLLWDILLSPFGADRRIEDAIFIAILTSFALRHSTKAPVKLGGLELGSESGSVGGIRPLSPVSGGGAPLKRRSTR